eukprot:9333022-Pyramimonas_sp.AAC.3
MEGLFRRAMAIKVPGMFLSQPGREMLPSYHCALITCRRQCFSANSGRSSCRLPLDPVSRTLSKCSPSINQSNGERADSPYTLVISGQL